MDQANSPSALRNLNALLYLGYRDVILTPYWILSNLLPSWRGHPTWTLSQAVTLRRWGWGLTSFCPRFQEIASRPISYEPSQSELEKYGVGFTRTEVYDGELKGEIGQQAMKWDVKRIRVGVWWYGETEGGKRTDYRAEKDERVVLYFHGGGYISGTGHPDQITSLIPAQLCTSSHSIRRAAVIDYRLSFLAPHHRGHGFPTALVDAISAFYYLLSLGFHAAEIVVSGDSAGANLALALTRYLVEEEKIKPGGLLLISPWVDMTDSHAGLDTSRRYNRNKDNIGTIIAPWCYPTRAFVRGMPAANPYISPACKTIEPSFLGFPKTYITVGELEVLLDETRTLRDRMKDVVEGGLTYEEQPNLPHDICIYDFMEPERTQILQRMANWIDAL